MNDNSKEIPWKNYAVTVAEVWLAFCIATFSMGIYFTHLKDSTWAIFFAALMIAMYLFVIFACIKRLIQNLSIAALMLLVPIAPLAILLLVLSLLPVIQQCR